MSRALCAVSNAEWVMLKPSQVALMAWTQGLPRQPYGSNFDTLFDRVCLTCNGSGEIFDPGFCVMCGRKKPVEICPTCNGTGKTGS